MKKVFLFITICVTITLSCKKSENPFIKDDSKYLLNVWKSNMLSKGVETKLVDSIILNFKSDDRKQINLSEGVRLHLYKQSTKIGSFTKFLAFITNNGTIKNIGFISTNSKSNLESIKIIDYFFINKKVNNGNLLKFMI